MTEEMKKSSGKCCAKKGMIGLVILLIVIAGLVVWNNQKTEKAASDYYGVWYEKPKAITPFTLESTEGGNFTEQSFKGHWSWVFFGFTNCPNMCPNTMKAFKEAVEKLRADNMNPLPQVILVSLDPERDTLPILDKYVTSFDPSFIGLAGSMDQVELLANQMNVSFKNMGNGMIQHSGNVTVVNPNGEIQGYFPWVDEPAKVAQDYEEIVRSHS